MADSYDDQFMTRAFVKVKETTVYILSYYINLIGVAEPEVEPEPVEQQLFSGAGAGYKKFFKMLQKP
jgi:hypothetical protein